MLVEQKFVDFEKVFAGFKDSPILNSGLLELERGLFEEAQQATECYGKGFYGGGTVWVDESFYDANGYWLGIFVNDPESHVWAEDFPPSYGKCDSPQQFIDMYRGALERSPLKWFVTFVDVMAGDSWTEGEAWRKFGPHIGGRSPEYGDKIYLFKVWLVE